MPGLPKFSAAQLSAEQIQQYDHNPSPDTAAREIASALGLGEYQSDAATAVCVDFVSYALNFARDSNFTQQQSGRLLQLAQTLLQETAGGCSVGELQNILKQQLKDYTATGDDKWFLPKQILQIADFFSTGLFAHSKLYNFLFTQPQAHDEQNIILQVETAVVQPLKDALTEEQWVQHNASLAAEAGAHKQAQEAADRERQLAEAAAAQHQAAEAAEALRHSTLTKL
ncbi:hypothetical protein ABBQ32_001051 [Trebouxia sp. C0010 RCD-2024]